MLAGAASRSSTTCSYCVHFEHNFEIVKLEGVTLVTTLGKLPLQKRNPVLQSSQVGSSQGASGVQGFGRVVHLG